MPLNIVSVDEGSPAAKAGIRTGDRLLRINGEPIDDFLDLQYHSANENLSCEIIRADGQREVIRMRRNWSRPLGIEPEPHRCRTCMNNCIFCFVDQMRPGARETLNLKDDDPAYSFTFGNFITLTNLGKGDWRRIVTQRRSPLYISVHTTDPALHREMLRYRHAFDITQALHRLDEEGIEMHTQIVVVPGVNDGIHLDKTLADLLALKTVLTVGIVPVGLTRYRDRLPHLDRVDAKLARELLRQAESANVGEPEPRVFCSDEIYLLADEFIPPADHYGDFAQIENGIGMVRMLRENWYDRCDDFISELSDRGGDFVIVTGELAEPVLQDIANDCNEVLGPDRVRVAPLRNNWLGDLVTVVGLLSASDIRHQLRLREGETAILPSSVFNHDGFTLDDVHRDTLRQEIPFFVVDELLHGWESVNPEDAPHGSDSMYY